MIEWTQKVTTLRPSNYTKFYQSYGEGLVGKQGSKYQIH